MKVEDAIEGGIIPLDSPRSDRPVSLSRQKSQLSGNRVATRRSQLTEDDLIELSHLEINLPEILFLSITLREKCIALVLLGIQLSTFVAVMWGSFIVKHHEMNFAVLLMVPSICLVNAVLIINKLSTKSLAFVICKLINIKYAIVGTCRKMSSRDQMFIDKCQDVDLEFKILVAVEIISALIYAISSVMIAIVQDTLTDTVSNSLALSILYHIDEPLCNIILPSFKTSVTCVLNYAEEKKKNCAWVSAGKSKLFWLVLNWLLVVMLVVVFVKKFYYA